MPLLDMNMNMNMNMGFAASTPSGRSLRPRLNSDVASRLITWFRPRTLSLRPLARCPGTPCITRTGMPICVPICTSTTSWEDWEPMRRQ